MTTHSIECSEVSKRYRRYSASRPRSLKRTVLGGWRKLLPQATLWALRDVDFRVAPGQMLGVIGHNGAGKSTLLRLLGGVSRADKGAVRVRGRIGALLDLELGFHPDLTGRENALLNGVMSGLRRRTMLQRMDAIVEFAELEGFMDAPLRTYSTGMRMRLGFSIAAHADPDVLLIDEVLSVGDMSFQRRCMERIADYKARGVAVLLVSHNLHEVRQLCDEVLWLDGGRVRALGETSVVLEEYQANVAGVVTASVREPTVRSASGGAPLRLHENRIGTLQMEIAGVQLTDGAGRPVAVLTSGRALQVTIDYLPHGPIASPVFQVKIVRDADGFVCWEGNTAAAGTVLSEVCEPGRVHLRVERLHLAQGSYSVEVGAYETGWARVYDYHFRLYPLRIESPHCGGEGVLDLPAHWELLPAQGGAHALSPPEPETAPARLTGSGVD